MTDFAQPGTQGATQPAPLNGDQIDVRGPQFSAIITSVVLAAVLVLGGGAWGIALLAIQAVLFAVGVGLGVQRTPHAWAFRRFIRPRLGPTPGIEFAGPPRFAQAVGLLFTVFGLGAFLAGWETLGLIAVGFALVAALLNAVFRFCLGCELYLLLRRLAPTS